jgi:hypothetical protein
VKLLTVQIKETTSQFSTLSYLPSGQKKSGISGHNNYKKRADAEWGTFSVQKKIPAKIGAKKF